MPKISEPRIRLVIRKEKPLKSGLYPIFLRVNYRGMKERATGVCCDIEHWNEADETVKRGFPNYKNLNSELSVIKAGAISVMQQQKYAGKGFDLASILLSKALSDDRLDGVKPGTLSALIDQYIRSHSLSKNTRNTWRTIKNHLIDCFDDKVDNWDIDKYLEYLNKKGICDSSIALLMGKVKALGLNMKNIDTRRWRVAQRNEYIPLEAMRLMKKRLLSLLVVDDGSMWNFTDDIINVFEGFEKRVVAANSILALYYAYFLFLTGLAPIDAALLKKANVQRKNIDGKIYYIIDGVRHKTGVKFKISLLRTREIGQIIDTMFLLNGSEYFLPICYGLDSKDFDKCNQRQRNVFERCSRKYMPGHITAINGDIIQHNVDNKVKIPLIRNFTYYICRHSLAMAIFNNPNATMAQMAQWMGRSPNTIAQYIHQLQGEADEVEQGSLIDF